MKVISTWVHRVVLFVLFLNPIVDAGEGELSGSFGNVKKISPELNDSRYCSRPGSVSANGLEFYFDSTRHTQSFCNSNASDIFLATRTSENEEFGNLQRISLNDDSRRDSSPRISFNGLRLYFISNRDGGLGSTDIWVATRASDEVGSPFTEARPLDAGPVNSPATERRVTISCDERILVFHSADRSGGRGKSDLWIAERSGPEDVFSVPVNLGSVVNTDVDESAPHISCSGLTVFFHDWWQNPRPGNTSGNSTIWATTRSTVEDPFIEPIQLHPSIEAPGIEGIPAVTYDWPASGSKIYFAASSAVGVPWELFEATWIHVPIELRAEISDEAVTLSWSNPITYDSLSIYRRGFEFAILDGAETSFTDSDPFDGCYDYWIYAKQGQAGARSQVVRVCFPKERVKFIRGDVNIDSSVDISDGIALLNFLFLGGPKPVCMDSADMNDDGKLELTDASYLFNFLFLGGHSPRHPSKDCGFDPTIDRLACQEFKICNAP